LSWPFDRAFCFLFSVFFFVQAYLCLLSSSYPQHLHHFFRQIERHTSEICFAFHGTGLPVDMPAWQQTGSPNVFFTIFVSPSNIASLPGVHPAIQVSSPLHPETSYFCCKNQSTDCLSPFSSEVKACQPRRSCAFDVSE